MAGFNLGVIQGATLSLQVIILFGTYLEIKPTQLSVNTKLILFTFKLNNKLFQSVPEISFRILSTCADFKSHFLRLYGGGVGKLKFTWP